MLSYYVGCRTAWVGKTTHASLAASVPISFQETQFEPFVLLSCSFLVSSKRSVCAWSMKFSLAILHRIFLLPSARCTKL